MKPSGVTDAALPRPPRLAIADLVVERKDAGRIVDRASLVIEPGAVVAITGPDATKAEIDVTDLDSAAKQFKGGLADFGRMSVEMHWVPKDTVHQKIRNDFLDVTSPVHHYKLTFQEGTVWAFSAYVAGMPATVQGDNVLRITVALRMTGPVTETPGP